MRVIALESSEITKAINLYESINYNVVISANTEDITACMGYDQNKLTVNYNRYIIIDDKRKNIGICTDIY